MTTKKLEVTNEEDLERTLEWFRKRFPDSDKDDEEKFIRSVYKGGEKYE